VVDTLYILKYIEREREKEREEKREGNQAHFGDVCVSL